MVTDLPFGEAVGLRNTWSGCRITPPFSETSGQKLRSVVAIEAFDFIVTALPAVEGV